ncbi:MAG: hypothetical protein WCC37_15360, partial [Candidatus Sulfotelmatobacter sp.]
MGAGVLNATTARLLTEAGGLAAGFPVPSTLLRTGSIAAIRETGAAASSFGGTETKFRATAPEFTNVSRDTIVTPPLALR